MLLGRPCVTFSNYRRQKSSPGAGPNMRRLCRHGHLLEAAVKTLRNFGLSWCSIENATFVALKKKFSSVISGGISRNFSSSFNPTHGSLMNLGIPNSEMPKCFWCVYLSPSTMWIWLKGKYLIHLESRVAMLIINQKTNSFLDTWPDGSGRLISAVAEKIDNTYFHIFFLIYLIANVNIATLGEEELF